MLILFLSFCVFSFLGIPLYVGLGLASILYLFYASPDLVIMVPQRIWAGMDTYVLIALPLFILAGELMNTGGITKRIINFSLQLVRPFKGGLGEVGIVSSMIFAGISGSSVADTTAIGSVLIPAMEEKGFNKRYATGLIVAASTMGIIIPPSIPMITYSMVSGVSIGMLFMAGVLPGVLIGVFQLIAVQIYKRKHNLHLLEAQPVKGESVFRATKDGLLAMIMPGIIVASILLGVATASESAGIAVLYAFVIGIFVFKELKIRDLPRIIRSTVISTSAIMIIIGFSMIFGWVMAMEKVPDSIAAFLLDMNIGRMGILALLDVFVLFLGTFLDITPILLLITPIFLPVVAKFGVDPLQFGIILIVGSAIGLVTPPLGMCLNAANKISKLPIMEIFYAAWPFLLCNFIVLLLVTFIPQMISLPASIAVK
jgi:tripartite ATP-independent transporter DctM subunit